jgi:hypothetical protein
MKGSDSIVSINQLNTTENKLVEIYETTFADSEIKERQHIEEWIRKSP